MAKNPLTERDVYFYLIETVQPIYADLVATLGEKPTQVVFQFEAAFVHLAVARTRPEVSQVNIEKAMGHLQQQKFSLFLFCAIKGLVFRWVCWQACSRHSYGLCGSPVSRRHPNP
ncbi:hypothetical protein LRB11_15185 [Ectothiorhodospira haloalkaliphila]|uniref:hypothetical protein n=1 Tax=Ectothiorhodospira haloalkaliphila TaxID=421628 RepID=UPI001EE827EF|nr:hypothetical protein [Ectothiorhodospira haloalkaliphila]MCG5526259.1 hypothetical protein [Ectothiorhodospira haloalkaliphila]